MPVSFFEMVAFQNLSQIKFLLKVAGGSWFYYKYVVEARDLVWLVYFQDCRRDLRQIVFVFFHLFLWSSTALNITSIQIKILSQALVLYRTNFHICLEIVMNFLQVIAFRISAFVSSISFIFVAPTDVQRFKRLQFFAI